MSEIIKFEKIVGDGKALGYWNGKACFVAGPLPGESAEVTIVRDKRRHAEGVLDHITDQSPRRQAEVEPHFLSCSPWQGVDYEYQLELKAGMLRDAYGRLAAAVQTGPVRPSPQTSGYRNKLQFTLQSGIGGWQLGLYGRGSHEFRAAPEGCRLGSTAMNQLAIAAVEVLGQLGTRVRAVSLTVREHDDGLLLVLEVEPGAKADWTALDALPASGIIVYSRLGGGDRLILHESGVVAPVFRVDGLKLTHPWDAFAQVNMPAFQLALADIAAVVKPELKVMDLYGGSGAIGLPLARVAGSVLGIEIDSDAVAASRANADRNQLTNYDAKVWPPGQAGIPPLVGADIVVVDPPRNGLTPRVIDSLMEAAPARIIYLSCNPVTQARDVAQLLEAYQSGVITGYDFYPGTLHLEALAVLERRP